MSDPPGLDFRLVARRAMASDTVDVRKLKRLLRSAGEWTVSSLWAFLGRSLYAFGPQECAASLRHCRYNTTG